jgi:hypothetical protein
LGLHPDVVTWYEPRTLWLYADPGRGHDEFDEKDATQKVIKYIRGRFLKYQSRHGGRRVMEKTPSNVLKVPYVNAIFPEASFLHITRNPFSYINSMELHWQQAKTLRGLRRSFASTPVTQLPYYARHMVDDLLRKKVLKKKYASISGPRYRGIAQDLKQHDKLRVIARQWAICNRKAREDLAVLGKNRVFSFRYEDLIENPETYFQRIYNHCGLVCNDDMVRTAKEMVDPGRQEKWHRLDRQQLLTILPEIQAEMEYYGYEVPAALCGMGPTWTFRHRVMGTEPFVAPA